MNMYLNIYVNVFQIRYKWHFLNKNQIIEIRERDRFTFFFLFQTWLASASLQGLQQIMFQKQEQNLAKRPKINAMATKIHPRIAVE